jgi:RecQ-mediated genome instability protein 1
MLGGKIEAWQKTWVDGRLARLKEEIRQNERQAS